ncbi:MAG: hypothetical protein GY758_01015 [Fuerstiella sp.]|nr:hypothetical protein [Fuerstiella sp.]
MTVTNTDFIADIVQAEPAGGDPRSEGDDQFRELKKAVQQSFPNIDAQVDWTAFQMNDLARKSNPETIGAAWAFSSSVSFPGLVAPIILDKAGEQRIQKNNGDLQMQTVGAYAVHIRPNSSTRLTVEQNKITAFTDTEIQGNTTLLGQLRTDQLLPDAALGGIVARLEVFDELGVSQGFLRLRDA